VRREVQDRSDALAQAYRERDHDKLRAELVNLDALVDEHLAFARKSATREYTESITVAVLIALFLRAFALEAFKIPSGSMIPSLEIGDHIFVNKLVYGLRIPGTHSRLFEVRKPERGEVVVFINPCEPDKDFIKRIVALPGDTVEVRCDILYVNGKPVPAELISEADTACTYWDFQERPIDEPWEKKSCSRYRETLDGQSYETISSPLRPIRERERVGRTAYTHADGDRDFPEHALPRCDDPSVRAPLGEIAPVSAEESQVAGVEEACRPRRHYVVPAGHVFVMGDNRAHSSDSRQWGPVPLENIKGKAMFVWWSSQDRPDGGVLWDRIGKLVHL
jgi:signal peptidase I